MGEEVLGTAAKIEVTKENCTIVGDGSSEEAVKSRVKQIKNIVANTDQDYEKEKLTERIARLSGGVAIIQVAILVPAVYSCFQTNAYIVVMPCCRYAKQSWSPVAAVCQVVSLHVCAGRGPVPMVQGYHYRAHCFTNGNTVCRWELRLRQS